VCVENPAKDYAPSPGTLQNVQWNDLKGSRIGTWVRTGSKATSNYDPLPAKVMFHGATREGAIKGITEILARSHICGPLTNLEFLAIILRGFSHSGPMDPLAFRIANFLVGNTAGTEGLEITLGGPDLKFLGAVIVARCGAPMEAKLDGKPFSMWTRVRINPGQRLTIGKTTFGGCRSYLAVYGGFPSVAEYFGSKSTGPMAAVDAKEEL
jgi:urea carboxylase